MNRRNFSFIRFYTKFWRAHFELSKTIIKILIAMVYYYILITKKSDCDILSCHTHLDLYTNLYQLTIHLSFGVRAVSSLFFTLIYNNTQVFNSSPKGICIQDPS